MKWPPFITSEPTARMCVLKLIENQNNSRGYYDKYLYVRVWDFCKGDVCYFVISKDQNFKAREITLHLYRSIDLSFIDSTLQNIAKNWTTTLSRRLTMHLNYSSSIAFHLNNPSISKFKFRKILVENTTIIAHEIGRLRLQILKKKINQ